ncbi:hypothetical protein IIM36_004336 [Escherichia coli]|nr:hypothetical protein [Escherichia coli]
MRDFQNAFDAALAGVDSTIVEVMGIRAQFTSGAQRGGEVQGVFDDPESLGFAGGGVRIEGSSPSLFVRTDTVRAVRRGDTLTINGEMFWVDRVSPDDGGSCYLWLNRGQPSGTVAKGKTTTLTVSFEPESATDKTFRAVSADPSKATISVKDMTITVNGVATGKVQIPVVSGNGQFAAVAQVTVTEAGAAG